MQRRQLLLQLQQQGLLGRYIHAAGITVGQLLAHMLQLLLRGFGSLLQQHALLLEHGRLNHRPDQIGRQTQPCSLQLQILVFFSSLQTFDLPAIAAKQIGAVRHAELGRVIGIERVTAVERRRHGLARVLARGVVAHLHGWQKVAALRNHVLVRGAKRGLCSFDGRALVQRFLHHLIELGTAKRLPPLGTDFAAANWQGRGNGRASQGLRCGHSGAHIVRPHGAATEQGSQPSGQSQGHGQCMQTVL